MEDSMRFQIPERDEDLLVASGNSYHVEFVPDPEVAVNSVNLFADQLRGEGWWCLKEYFDCFFAIVKTGSEVDSLSTRIKLAFLISRGLRSQVDDLNTHLTYACEPQITEEVVEESARHSDSLLMYLYLLGRLNSNIESEWVNKQRDNGGTKPQKGKKVVAEIDSSDGLTRWPSLRNDILELLLDILEIEVVAKDGRKVRNAIRYLWRPSTPNPALIKTITRVLLDWLDSPEHKLRSNGWLVQMFRLLVPLCINYNQQSVLGALLLEKTIHLEYAREAYPFVEAIQRQTINSKHPEKYDPGVKKCVLDPLLTGMLAQVAMLNPDEFNSNNSNNSSRPLVNFIQTVSYRAPHLMIRQISSLMRFLTEDPWQLRAAVLTAMADVICSKEMEDTILNQDPIRKDARDKMLKILAEHLKDCSTQVRAKVTNLWKQIADCDRIPFWMIDAGILDDMAARLEDKLVSVRKPAISFMTTFLKKNPYGHDFTFDLNFNQFKELLEKRECLRRQNPENAAQSVAFKQFHDATPKLRQAFLDAFNSWTEDDINDEDDGTEEYVNTMIEACASQVVISPETTAMGVVCLIHMNRLQGIDIRTQTIPEIIDDVIRRLETIFVTMSIKMNIESEEWQLMNEENKGDYEARMRRLEYNIWWMRSKIQMEMCIAESLQNALRGALQGDSAELKEAINFIIQCKNFMIRGADEVVRVVFSLIWKNNLDIQKEVISAAKQMFISTNSDIEVAHKSTAENMLTVLEGISEIERSCVEEVICRMAATTDYTLPDEVLQHVLSLLSKSDTEQEKKLRCVKLLGILAKAVPDSARSRLRILQRMIKNEEIEIAVEALDVIASLGAQPVKDGVPLDPVRSRRTTLRIPKEDSIFKDVVDFFLREFLEPNCNLWTRVVRGTLGVIFEIGRDSSLIASQLVSQVLWYLSRAARSTAFYEAEGNKVEQGSKVDSEKGKKILERRMYWRDLFDKMLERTLIFAGDISLRVFVYIDTVIVKEMKKLQEVINVSEKETPKSVTEKVTDDKKNETAKDKKERALPKLDTETVIVNEIPVRAWDKWEVESAMRQGVFTFLQTGLGNRKKGTEDTGGQDDGFSDLTTYELAKQMQSTGLLGRLLPLVNFCVRAKGTSKHSRNAAATAFVKMIPISQQYAGQASFLCMLLMTASSDPQIRENILVSMPDIYQFVSLPFDNYQSELFNMCRDVNAAVRETALLVLLYVTADGIVQSRSGIADVARCYVDPIEDISIMTKVFFTELSRKKNTIANAMPDFLSRLSRNPKHISLDDFKKIMTFLFEFLEDREIEDLLPRMLTRMESIDADSLRRNPELPCYIMFCLQWLAKSEKAFYKIRDAMKLIEPHLHLSGVMESLMIIMDKMKKANHSHPEFPHEVARFVEELQGKHSEYAAGHKAIQKASAYQRRVEESKRRRARNKMAAVIEEDSD